MPKIEKILFSGRTHTIPSRRDGSAHGTLDIHLSSAGDVASEEQFEAVPPHPIAERLFAGAWSACYSGALALTAQQMKVKLPADLAVGIEVDLGQVGNAFLLQARLNVRAPGMDQEVAERLAHGAHEICPYSKATRGNIGVVLSVVTV